MELDILFLDIDGVLSPCDGDHACVFAPECVAQLKRLFTARPQLKIVFSTSWRIGTPFFVLGWLWRQHELPLKAVVGRTSDLGDAERGNEIRKWLADAKLMFPGSRVRRYAAVDDETYPLLAQLPPGTVFGCEPDVGLTKQVADRVIQHFRE